MRQKRVTATNQKGTWKSSIERNGNDIVIVFIVLWAYQRLTRTHIHAVVKRTQFKILFLIHFLSIRWKKWDLIIDSETQKFQFSTNDKMKRDEKMHTRTWSRIPSNIYNEFYRHSNNNPIIWPETWTANIFD